jgi:hypothetical protein
MALLKGLREWPAGDQDRVFLGWVGLDVIFVKEAIMGWGDATDAAVGALGRLAARFASLGPNLTSSFVE